MLRKCVRWLDSTVNFAVLVLLLVLLGYGGYSLWDSKQVYADASSAQYEIFKPREDDTATFDDLREKNEDVFGWLTVYGTGIDYPLVQGKDDWEYLNKDAEGNYNLGGAIFLSAANRADLSDYNNIIHGHHMAQGAMFGDLEKYQEEAFFASHSLGCVYVNGKEHGLVIFAYILADAYDSSVYASPIHDAAGQQAYLELLQSKATHLRWEGQAQAEKLLLLSTCSTDMTNGRYVLAAYLTEEVFENPFCEETPETEHKVTTLDRLAARNESQRLPLWLWLVLVLAGLVLVLTVFDILSPNPRKKRAIRNQSFEKEGNGYEKKSN